MDPADFEQHLTRQGKAYELQGGLDTPVCQVRFTGPFNDETVIWDATLMSLTYYLQQQAANGQPDPAARQFIDVGANSASGRHITIALQVPLIDEPTILKAMIMARQYKRLARGKHEYGETHKL